GHHVLVEVDRDVLDRDVLDLDVPAVGVEVGGVAERDRHVGHGRGHERVVPAGAGADRLYETLHRHDGHRLRADTRAMYPTVDTPSCPSGIDICDTRAFTFAPSASTTKRSPSSSSGIGKASNV